MADRKDAARVLTECIVQSHWDENLHMLPASLLQEQAERKLQGIARSPYRLADPLAKIAPPYAAIVIDTRPSFSLMTEMALVADKVRDFNEFTPDNDPYGEHHFGCIEHDGQKIFWKFDYCDMTLQYGSEDPADPEQTMRVLTIMLAEEY